MSSIPSKEVADGESVLEPGTPVHRVPLVAIVVVNWNRLQDTLECLQSLYQQTYSNAFIVLVDNGSTDHSAEILLTCFPAVKLLRLSCNSGFAAGYNQGINFALQLKAALILMVNNDTRADPCMLERLVATMRSAEAGLVAPLIYSYWKPWTIWSAGGRQNRVTLEMTDRLPCCLLKTDNPLPVERDYLTGCALLISREVFDTVGFFDQRFFAYYEDLDFCLRARQAGFRLWLQPQAYLWHKVSASAGGGDSPEERQGMAKSSVLFFRKHIQGWRWMAVAPYRLLAALRITLRLLFRGRWAAAAAYWQGLYQGIRF